MRKLLLAGLVLSSSLTMWSQGTYAQTVTASVARQTSRQISDAIQARITQSQLAEVSAEDRRNQAWFNFAHEYASADVQGIDISGHAYGPLMGVDSAISDFYLGLTLEYFRFNAELGNTDIDANIYGVAPYVAWVVSDYFFVSLLAGYYALDFDDSPRFQTLDTIHSGYYEIDFNAMLSRERLEVVVKAGFNHDFRKVDKGSEESFDHFYTFIAGGDVGYRIGTVKPYVRVWWEGDIDDINNDFTNTGFFGGGVTVDVTDRFTVGLNGWGAVGEEFDVITHGGLTLRYKF